MDVTQLNCHVSQRKALEEVIMPERGRTILITGGSPADGTALRGYLNQNGEQPVELIEAESGRKGLVASLADQPDFILLAASLPDMTVLEFLTALEAQNEPTGGPVVILVGVDDEAAGLQALRYGAQDFLRQENLSPESLRQTLSKAAQRAALLNERKQAEAKLRLTVETAQMGYWEWDPVANTVTCDDYYEQVFGLTPGSFGGTYEAFLELLHPDEREAIHQTVQQALAEKTNFGVEFRVVWSNGELHWLACKSQLLRNDAGQVTRMVGVVRDVTERKTAAEAMTRYQLLSQHTRDIVLFIRASDGRIIEANRAAETAYGYDRASLLSKTIHELRDPATRNGILDQMEQAKSSSILFETRHCRSNGAAFPVEVSSSGADLGGERLLLSIIRDISERKQAEAALRQSQERLQVVLRAGRMGWWERDLRTNEVNWSDSFFDLLGQSPKGNRPSYEVFLERVFPEDRQKVIKKVTQTIAERSEYSMEYRLLHPNGGVRWIIEKGKVFYDPADKPERIVGVSLDMTQRKWIEEGLRESEATLRSFYDNAPLLMGLVEISEHDILHLYDNPASHRFLGLAANESSTGRWTSHLGTPPTAIHELLEHFKKCEASGQPVHFEYFHQVAGEARCLAATVSVIGPGPSGRTRFCYVAQDITERKRTENQQRLLAELGETMRHTVEPDELLLAVVRTVGEYLQVKRCLFAEIDAAHDQGMIRHEYCLDVPSIAGPYKISEYSQITRVDMEAGRTVVNYDAQMDPRTAANYETTYKRYGERAYVALPLRREGQWVSVFWVSTDSPRQWRADEISLLETVAERAWLAVENARLNAATKIALEQARTSEQWFRELADSLPQLVWISNSEGVLDYYNRRVSEYGSGTRTPDDRWQWQPLLHPDDLEPTLAAWQAAAASEQPYSFEHRMGMADGSYRWHLSRAVPIRDNTGTLQWFGTATDIHDLRLAQEALRLKNS